MNVGLHIIIQREGEHYRPIVIDFGKSEEIIKLKAYKRSADYLAPEVREEKKKCPASDIFSFGRMLQLSISGRSFFHLFTAIIVRTTSHRAEDRPSQMTLFQLLEILFQSQKTSRITTEYSFCFGLQDQCEGLLL